MPVRGIMKRLALTVNEITKKDLDIAFLMDKIQKEDPFIIFCPKGKETDSPRKLVAPGMDEARSIFVSQAHRTNQ